jgi:hypothetical protein
MLAALSVTMNHTLLELPLLTLSDDFCIGMSTERNGFDQAQHVRQGRHELHHC